MRDSVSSVVPAGARHAGAFPRVAEYVRRLPRGLESYPTCLAKPLFIREALATLPWSCADFNGVLPALRPLFTLPMLASSWVSEVKFWAFFLLLADDRRMSDGEFVLFCRGLNSAILSRRAYSVLTELPSPSSLLDGIASRYGAFHRGTDASVAFVGPTEAIVTIRYPSFLINDLIAAALATGFDVALENSRAVHPRVEVIDTAPRVSHFRATWHVSA